MNEAIERNAFDQLLFDKELRLLEVPEVMSFKNKRQVVYPKQ